MKNGLDPSKTQTWFWKLGFRGAGGGGVTELFFADLCQRSAHRLNFQQREETPVWQRAKSLNK